MASATDKSCAKSGADGACLVAKYVVDPAARKAKYRGNTAQYLVDLHDSKAVFNFCGGMLFQLSLSDRLRTHLAEVAKGKGSQPVVYDASKRRMYSLPGYTKSNAADNAKIFHGREVRKVPSAAGGFGFVLQLSMAGVDDPQGWTKKELSGYDGWGHDSSRVWRKRERLESEGFTTFGAKFHSGAFALHHRFYFHLDSSDRLWLTAEDGCEGVVAQPKL